MVTLKKFLESIGYQITGGAPFMWKAFGDNANFLDSEQLDDCSATTIFDTKDQTVYMLEAHDYVNSKSYRWINPHFIEDYITECNERDIDYNVAYDGVFYTDMDNSDDMLEKIREVLSGPKMEVIPLDLDTDLILFSALEAHRRDITLNEYITNALVEEIRRLEEKSEQDE